MSDNYEWPDRFWPHQLSGCLAVLAEIERGNRRIVLTSPTGTGKSAMMTALIEWATSEFWDSAMYTHRKLLLAQLSRTLAAAGVEHGLRAAGHEPALLRAVQLIMTQSEISAVFKRKRRELHPAKLVLEDELHAQGGSMLPEISRQHYDMGAAVIGVTATPLDLEGSWDVLVTAGTNSDGRKCGALVPAITYCPDTPNLKHIKNYRVGDDLTDKENAKAIMRPGVFGRVYTHWHKLNPDHKPTILFGPDVAGSIYFAEQFHKNGVRSAHIDAKQIWLAGEYMDSSDENRQMILKMTETGEVEVLCNRFILREGIDLPHIAVGILACVFGSLKTYLQSVGRILRKAPGMDSVILIDHGGNYIRHGSPNADREWVLGMSGYKETAKRQEAMREKPDMEPIVCPKCGACRLSGPKCHQCGFETRKRSRLVVQIDGTLKMVEGPSFKPKRIAATPTAAKDWERMYHRARSPKWNATFAQAEAMYMMENRGFYPPKDLPLMPVDPSDFFEKVRDVPRERLR